MKRLFMLAIAAGLVGGAMKLAAVKRQFMVGTEDELRDRVRTKFGDRVPADKLEQVEDKVVEYARAKGTLVEPGGAAQT